VISERMSMVGKVGTYSYARGFRVSAHSNLGRLVIDSIGFSVLKRALK